MAQFARGQELQRRAPKSVPSVLTPSNLPQAVHLVTRLREADATSMVSILKNERSLDARIDLLAAESAVGLSPAGIKRLLCMCDIGSFAMSYLAHHFTWPPETGEVYFEPAFHLDLFDILQKIMNHETDRPAVIAGFPDCGKSTCISLLAPLHNICCGVDKVFPSGRVFRQKRYHLYVSSTQKMAQKILAAILEELETNKKIISDFGELFKDPTQQHRRSKEWSAFKARTFNGIFLEAVGKKMDIRSIKRSQYRPDFGIVDDVQGDASVNSPTQREEDMKWVLTVLLNRFAQDRGNVIFTGNIIHDFSLISRLIEHGKKNGWLTRIYKMYELNDDGSKTYLMPKRFDAKYEAKKRDLLMGSDAAFEQEFLQNPGAQEGELDGDSFVQFDMDDLDDRWPFMEGYMAMDPAASADNPRADQTAIATLAFDTETGISYLLPMFLDRVSISGQVQAYVAEYIRWRPYKYGVESVAYQKIIPGHIDEVAQKAHFTMDTLEIKQDTGRRKHQRIARLFPAIKSGMLRFLNGDPHQDVCKRQLITISKALKPDHDDAADALEMAFRLKDEEYMDAASGGIDAVIL